MFTPEVKEPWRHWHGIWGIPVNKSPRRRGAGWGGLREAVVKLEVYRDTEESESMQTI